MSVVSNLKRMKRCTAELTDAKLRTAHTCTVHGSHLYSSHMYLFNAAVPVEDETEQSMGLCTGEHSTEDIHSSTEWRIPLVYGACCAGTENSFASSQDTWRQHVKLGLML